MYKSNSKRDAMTVPNEGERGGEKYQDPVLNTSRGPNTFCMCSKGLSIMLEYMKYDKKKFAGPTKVIRVKLYLKDE